VHCHQDIFAGRFEAPPDALADWKKSIVHLRAVPSLAEVGRFLRPEWIAAFLLYPNDLRPRLRESMPRLAMTQAEAEDIAAYLAEPVDPSASDPLGDVERGRALFEKKGCATCHLFSGSGVESATVGDAPPTAVQLAPDLHHTRGRLRKGAILQWLLDPQAVKPDTAMPKTPMTEEEARDLAAFILHAMTTPIPPRPLPERLPVLTRRVGYEEVSREVFHKVCRHCHAQPDFARGDGGPGMTGGFGFAGRHLDLSTYEGIHAGDRDDAGQPASVFRLTPDGTPLLVAAMLARQAEESGRPGPIRGMPLGLPSMSPEQIQLVESWIAQGRPE
jgi:cytochrome c2